MKELLILKICKILVLLKILDFDKVNKENTCGFYQGPMIIFYFGKRQLCVCNDPEGIPSDDDFSDDIEFDPDEFEVSSDDIVNAIDQSMREITAERYNYMTGHIMPRRYVWTFEGESFINPEPITLDIHYYFVKVPGRYFVKSCRPNDVTHAQLVLEALSLSSELYEQYYASVQNMTDADARAILR